MAVTWTPKQKQVIDSRNRNLLVSAAAGSGKTAVLVERIIQMISEGTQPLDIDRLLIMTFTNAAAAEMRERIGAAIEKKLRERPQDEHLWLQAALIPQAQIMTIDSFCLTVIRNHYNTLDIDPLFRIGDEGELTLLKGDVMEEMLEECYEEGDEKFFRFCEQFGAGRSDKGIEEAILRVWEFSQSHPWPLEWMQECKAEIKEEASGDFSGSLWMKFLFRDVRMQMEELAQQMEEALEVCREENGPLAYEPMLMNDVSRLTGIRQAAEEGDFDALYDRLSGITYDRLATVRGKDIDPEKKAFVSGCRDRMKKAVTKCKEAYAVEAPEAVSESIEKTRESMEVLFDLAARFDSAYKSAKKERNILDFNDLEHLALEVLLEEVPEEEQTEKEREQAGGKPVRRPSAAAEELSRQFEEILVDEYQDSNYVQETLINSISRERLGNPNVFMVGDVKQSIYRFRLARPELFMEKYHSYSREESKFQMIELQQNFRSRDTVLTLVNDVFYQIMTANLGGIRYTRETALNPGAMFPETEGHTKETGALSVNVRPSLCCIDTGEDAFNGLDEDDMDYTARELEAKLIASEIRRLVSEKEGMLVWDKNLENGEGAYRRARYGDMAILLRSMSGWSEVFVNVLMNEGIMAQAQTRTGYFSTVEVETVLSLLSVIDNPMQDIPLAAVLRSPIIGMSDDEMAWLMSAYKRMTKKNQDRGVYGAWKLWESERTEKEDTFGAAFSDEKGLAEERTIEVGMARVPERYAHSIWEKLDKFNRLLEDFRLRSRYLSIHELLYHIYRDSGYYEYVSAMPAGETRKANLDMLVEKAAAYEATSYKGLFHFVRYIEKLKKYDTDFGEAMPSGENENTVRIMSIHKSKGLEFPIVFLAGMGKRFNKQDAYGSLLLDADLGVASDVTDLELRVKSSSLKKQVLKRKMESDAVGEELRVLYVAMTRAKEALIMTGTDRSLETKLEKWRDISRTDGQLPYTVLSSASSYLDWLLMAAPAIPDDHLEIRQVKVGDLVGNEVLRQMEQKNAKEDLLHLDLNRIYDEERKEQLERALGYSYPFLEDTRLYTMVSVSELKKQSQIGRSEESLGTMHLEWKGEPLIADRAEDSEKQAAGTAKKGGAFRGTAYHTALERLPFHEIHSLAETRQALLELYEKGFFTEEAYNLVFPPVIWNFLKSPLGQRMAKAQAEGRLHKEQQFMIGIPAKEMGKGTSDEPVLVQGVIDACIEEDDGLVLIDYKTDYIPKEQKEQGEALLKERYQVQMDYYARALTQITEKPVKEKIIYSLALQKEIKVG